jgi:predicted DCC family thiol-disulfide oxidoreductase YuxK
MDAQPVDETVTIVFDGECPACRMYFAIQQLQKDGLGVRMIDARADRAVVESYSRRGINLDRDFVVEFRGRSYPGAEGIALLAGLGHRRSLLRKVNAALFGHPALAGLIYPVLRQGRILLMRMRGTSRLAA